MLSENTSAYLADFGVIAQVGTHRAAVILDATDASLLGDRVQSTSYTMTFRDKDFPGLGHGDSMTVDGEQFEIITVNSLDDGVFKHAILQKT